MKTRPSVQHSRTSRHSEASMLSAGVSIGFALVPLAVLAWAVPQTGIGFA